MTTTNKCPKCFAEPAEMIGPGSAVWQCGSRVGAFPGKPDEFCQATTCRILQLENKVARLIEAGREVVGWIGCSSVPKYVLEEWDAASAVDSGENSSDFE